LSTWLRDYLYIPLGGSQHGKWLTVRNLMLTMLLGGLWHGAGVFFIIWGLYHGLLLVLYRLVPIDKILVRAFGARWGKALAIFVFFHFVCVGWIFFRATPGQFLPIWNSIVDLPGALFAHVLSYSDYFAKVSLNSLDFLRVCLGMARGWVAANWTLAVYGWGIFLFSLPAILTDLIAYRRGVEFADLYEKMPTYLRVAVILLLIYAIQFFGRRESNEFIYFAF
jgi:hypothetical protein